MQNNIIPLLSISLILTGTSCSTISTRWHEEPVSESSVSMIGADEEEQELLRVESHKWAVIDINEETGQGVWSFQVRVYCKGHPHPEELPQYDGFAPCIFVPRIQYTLLDKDESRLATLVYHSQDLLEGICYGESKEFTQSGIANIDILKKVSREVVNIGKQKCECPICQSKH